MESFSNQMTASVRPKQEFIDLYKNIIQSYFDERKKDKNKQQSNYDEFADTWVTMPPEQRQSMMNNHHSLYVFPKNSASEPFNPNDFYTHQSTSIVNHELTKWFGTEQIAHALQLEMIENTETFLKEFFLLTFYSFHLDLSHDKKDTYYIAMSPGKKFKGWLVSISSYNTKTKLHLIKDDPSELFDSYTTFVIKTDVIDHDEINSFLEKNKDIILQYQRAAWMGPVEATEGPFQWPSDINELSTLKDWFHIEVYNDSFQLL